MTQQMIDFFHIEKNRLKTFENNPQKHALLDASLSRNGFMFTGDRYVCIFCFKQMKRIKMKDDVLKRHFKLNRSCTIFMNALNVPIDAEMFKKDEKLYQQIKLESKKALRMFHHH